MKTFKIFSVATIMLAMTSVSIAQDKTETLKVSGECGMCQKKIEKAAKSAGATTASWNVDTKILTVTYNSTTTNTAKIEKNIAKAGYDTPDVKAKDEDYKKLDKCCQYEREEASGKMSCCTEKCEMKDGKCKDEAQCKEKGCCKDSEKCKEMGCCGHGGEMAAKGDMSCCKKGAADAKVDCCKDGKCTKPGHDGKDCCKKAEQ